MDPKWAPCHECSCVDGDAGYERWEIKELWKSRICPRRQITTSSEAWLELFQHYQAGFLADSGGVLDQPAKYMEAMRFLTGVLASG